MDPRFDKRKRVMEPSPDQRSGSGGHARLLQTLSAGDVDAAWGSFRALSQVAPLDPAFEAWLRDSVMAFGSLDPPAPSVLPVRDRTDEAALRLLFAKAAFGAGFPILGVAVAREAMHRRPKSPAGTFLLCAMLVKTADPEAQHLLRHCLERFPQPSQGWTELGIALRSLGKREAALVCFARSEPGFAAALRQGLLAKELGRLDEARACFTQAVGFDSTSPRAWFLLGTAAQDSHDLPAAADAYRRVLALDATIAEAAVNLGTVLQDGGDVDGAKAAYRQAVTARPNTFGRVAQALTTSSCGELWLDLAALRRTLAG